jgi:hypothetical protein
VAELLPFESITHLFEDFEHTAWRLESRRGYAVDLGTERFERFRRGEKLEYDPAHPWHANVRRQTDAGKRFERVRVVDEPPTLGQRFLLASGLANVDAGEDIRNLRRVQAHALGMPESDFWLFDSRLLVTLHFDEQDQTLGVELSEDPAEIVKACQVRDAAWHYAIPTREFTAQVTSSA